MQFSVLSGLGDSGFHPIPQDIPLELGEDREHPGECAAARGRQIQRASLTTGERMPGSGIGNYVPSLIDLANGDSLEKPRIEPRRVNADDGDEANASRFTPRQRERMRRALIAMSQKK
jgi:hypothetical protein